MKKYAFPAKISEIYVLFKHGDWPIMHTHEHWEIMIITEGSYTHKINNITRTLNPNTLCLIRPSDVHIIVDTMRKQSSHINFEITDSFMKTIFDLTDKTLYDDFQKPDYIEFEISQRTTQYLIENIQKLHMMNRSEPNYNKLLMVLFFDLLRNILYQNIQTMHENSYPAPVSEMIKLMSDKQSFLLSIEELCPKSNYSHSHIINLFKKHLNMTPVRYFLNVKMNYAQNLLETTTMSIISISSQAGFASLSHFNIAFKKVFGITPGMYRKKLNRFYSAEK